MNKDQGEIWPVDPADDPATFPDWLRRAVRASHGHDLFVETINLGVVCAQEGDLLVLADDGVEAYLAQRIEP